MTAEGEQNGETSQIYGGLRRGLQTQMRGAYQAGQSQRKRRCYKRNGVHDRYCKGHNTRGRKGDIASAQTGLHNAQ